MKYAIFIGCTIPVRGLNYEISARKVLSSLGIELVDIPEFTCCGFPLKSISHEASILMTARNLALAEAKGLPILTLCNACTVTMAEAKHELDHNPELKERINSKLENLFGLRYEGKVQVKHFARILYEDFGLDNLKNFIKRPLHELRVAPHYGCHFVRPKEAYGEFDDPEDPKSLDELVRVTGAEPIPHRHKHYCCGGGVLGVREQTAYSMAKKKLDGAKEAGADAIISICPFCSVMFEGNQKKIEKTFNVKYKLPVIYYSQLLGLAMGFTPDELGFSLNRVKPKALLAKLGFSK
ncbi:MAG: hypothetical protein DRQ10_00080 [Candidatus Hydrothermota bacterium]|nr:MAG: hypothetical protein DRQ10_00080 [Candidatus Hydrothermae bacterium]